MKESTDDKEGIEEMLEFLLDRLHSNNFIASLNKAYKKYKNLTRK